MIYILLLAIPFAAFALFLYALFGLTQLVPQRFLSLYPEKVSMRHFNIVWVLGAILFLVFSYILITLLLQWFDRSNFFGPTENQTLGSVIVLLVLYPLPMIPAFLLSSLVQSRTMQHILKTSISKESL